MSKLFSPLTTRNFAAEMGSLLIGFITLTGTVFFNLGILSNDFISTSGNLAAAERPAAERSVAERPARKVLQIVNQYPHNKSSYCQGLEFAHDNETGKEIFYESTGQYGSSKLLKVDLKTGRTLKKYSLPNQFFGEGLASVGDRIYQLTWREGICFVYDKKSFHLKADYRYQTEGWGLAFDGTFLIISDGSSKLYFLDPETILLKKSINVTYHDNNGNVKNLSNINELEFIEGEIWANVYQTPYIVRIDPESGAVLQFFNLSTLIPKELKNNVNLVLNGIAFDPSERRLFLTGKCWPVLYEIKISDQ